MLFGGALNGGRVIADWPGLSQANLYEARDLKPTTSLDALLTGLAAETFAIDPARVRGALFPNVPSAKPMEGLMRT